MLRILYYWLVGKKKKSPYAFETFSREESLKPTRKGERPRSPPPPRLPAVLPYPLIRAAQRILMALSSSLLVVLSSVPHDGDAAVKAATTTKSLLVSSVLGDIDRSPQTRRNKSALDGP